MKVMILCGGKGTRLREHTETRPKPMVEVGGRPLLWHIMKLFGHAGHREFVLCLGYLGDHIREYFLNFRAMNGDVTIALDRPDELTYHDARVEPWTVTLAETGAETMTGGRVARAARYLGDDERFLLTYGDGVSDVDLEALVAFHAASGRLATLTGVRPPSRFGQLATEPDGQVLAFAEKPQAAAGLINGGFMVLERGAIDYLSEDEGCVLERAPLERLAADGQLGVYEHDGYWQCMDTFRDWQSLETQWRERRAPWRVW